MLRSCFLSSFIEFCSAVSEEKSKMSQPIRSQGGHLVFPIGPQNTNLVEDIEILLPVKFQRILFSGFWGEVENMSQPIRGQGSHLVFPISPKYPNLVEDIEILLPVKLRWILFSGFWGEVENVSANQRPGRPSYFSDRPEKPKLGRGSCFLSSFVEFHSAVWEKKSNMSQPIRGQGGHLVFPISPKNTYLVEDVEFLPPVTFRRNSVQRFQMRSRKYVSANQKQGLPSCFSDRPEKHKLGRGHWDLASCQVSVNSVQQFLKRSQKCFSQLEARAAILFSDQPEKHKLL